MKHKNMHDCNVHKYDMIGWYLAFPYLGAKHKCQGTSEVQEKTRDKHIKRFKHHSYTKINLIPGQAYYTKNGSGCFRESAQRI